MGMGEGEGQGEGEVTSEQSDGTVAQAWEAMRAAKDDYCRAVDVLWRQVFESLACLAVRCMSGQSRTTALLAIL